MSSESSRSRFWWGVRIAAVRLRFVALLVAAALVVGYWDDIRARAERLLRPRPAAAPGAARPAGDAEAIEYFCPMHPSVVRGEPGSCPICGMPLSKRKKSAAEALPGDALARVRLSPYRVKLAGVATARVERRPLERTIETVGTIDYDERRLARISARVRGRIDRLFVDFTGIKVKKGGPLVSIWSQDLFSGARELLLAKAQGGAAFEAAKQRLVLWGLTPEQVAEIVERGGGAGGRMTPREWGQPETQVEVGSPIAGTVIEKRVLAGDYVAEGAPMYTVADLGVVWMVARVFEDEASLVRVGAPVEIHAVAFPGRTFEGHVSFIEPLVDRETRTVGVRADVPNAGELLKPGMYARAVLHAPIGPSGTADAAEGAATEIVYRCCSACPEVETRAPGPCPKCGMPLTPMEIASHGEGEYVCECAMHPQEVYRAKAPGTCPLCGRALIATSTSTSTSTRVRPLAVPLEAVIGTGTRSIVYRESEPGVFDAVEIVVGPRAGEFYSVIKGLAEGDVVVARGAFLVDAEARLNPAAGSAFFGASGREAPDRSRVVPSVAPERSGGVK